MSNYILYDFLSGLCSEHRKVLAPVQDNPDPSVVNEPYDEAAECDENTIDLDGGVTEASDWPLIDAVLITTDTTQPINLKRKSVINHELGYRLLWLA